MFSEKNTLPGEKSHRSRQISTLQHHVHDQVHDCSWPGATGRSSRQATSPQLRGSLPFSSCFSSYLGNRGWYLTDIWMVFGSHKTYLIICGQYWRNIFQILRIQLLICMKISSNLSGSHVAAAVVLDQARKKEQFTTDEDSYNTSYLRGEWSIKSTSIFWLIEIKQYLSKRQMSLTVLFICHFWDWCIHKY